MTPSKLIQHLEKLPKECKIGHLFDGRCCYNINEGVEDHKECRYPYNPERENPKGEQCLKLEEEHFDPIQSQITTLQLLREEVEGKYNPDIILCKVCKDDPDESTGDCCYNSALDAVLTIIDRALQIKENK